jgi:hypothetical protein
VFWVDVDPRHAEGAGDSLALGVHAQANAELGDWFHVGRRDVRLQAELPEHGGRIEIAGDLRDAVGGGGVVDEVGARQRDRLPGSRACGHRSGIGPSH